MRIPSYSGRSRGGGLLGLLGNRFGLILLVVLGLVIWWFSNQKEGLIGRSQMITVSLSDEMQLGQQAYAQLLASEPILCSRGASTCDPRNGAVVSSVQRIGARIRDAALEWEAEGAPMTVLGDAEGKLPSWGSLADKFDWQFNVIESDEMNAFALPGGYVAVYTGILPVAANENGLAAIMGHEIGHALARHGAERMSQQQLMQFGQIAAGAVVGDMGYEAQRMVAGMFGMGAQVGVLLPFSRTHESEADMIGLELLVRACFDPREAPRLWERMAELGGGARPPDILSTHPDPAARARAFEEVMPTALAVYEQRCGRS
jgi:metalloendopeptidase OMA1, mitochondrial